MKAAKIGPDLRLAYSHPFWHTGNVIKLGQSGRPELLIAGVAMGSGNLTEDI